MFSWKQHIGWERRYSQRGPSLVSILVLLEAAHRPEFARLAKEELEGFRSLFSWKQHIGGDTESKSKRVKVFRSLFSWKQHIGL